jgi:two-component system sensor histidine kinase/response regulator
MIGMGVDWFKDLFDTDGFLTRGHCGPWSEPLKLAYIASNAVIALAYFLIPFVLFVFWEKRRQDIEQPWILLGFMAFITSCGLTHVGDIAAFWWPGYRLFTLISIVTAVLSIATALALPWVVKLLLTLPTPEQFRRLNIELQEAAKQKDAAIVGLSDTVAALHRQVDCLEQMRRTGLWVAEQELTLRQLRNVLESSYEPEATR